MRAEMPLLRPKPCPSLTPRLPTFVSVPEDLTLSCEDDIPFDLAVATDNCTSITVEVSDDLALEVALGEHLLTRTFTATDAQGNIAQAVQLISIVDATAPSSRLCLPTTQSSALRI